MSAYLVDRHHIAYLVHAMMDNHSFKSWLRHRANIQNDEALAVYMCNELTRENVASIEGRYPDTVGHSENMPGDTELTEPWTSSEYHSYFWHGQDPVQVAKAVACYQYQSCEHEGWQESFARKMTDALESAQWRRMPKYDNAEWGAPEPASGIRRII